MKLESKDCPTAVRMAVHSDIGLKPDGASLLNPTNSVFRALSRLFDPEAKNE